MRFSLLPAGLGICAALAGAAGQASLFPLSPYRLGGHGGPHFRLTTLEGHAALLGGGLLAVSTHPGFSWLVSAQYLEADAAGLEFGYGAIGCEAVFRPRKLIQPMAQFQAGYGLAGRNGETGHGPVADLSALVGFQLGRRLALGAGSYQARNSLSHRGQDFSLGYGGLPARYLAAPARRVHAACSLLGGGGGAGYEDAETGRTVTGGLAVFDTDALVELNVTEFLRVGFGAGYRLVPMGFEDLGPGELGGPTATVQVATGAF